MIAAAFLGARLRRDPLGMAGSDRSDLVRDLTLAEHLDEYLEVGSFEFLSQLAESQEFGGDAPLKTDRARNGGGAFRRHSFGRTCLAIAAELWT